MTEVLFVIVVPLLLVGGAAFLRFLQKREQDDALTRLEVLRRVTSHEERKR